MASELLEIYPLELKFTFELKKQSSCSVQLTNNSNHYVAFKVKTTAPKKYCVRPNTGIVLPRTTCDFTVTMQAQKAAPSDLQCKDKFLVQSTVVPFGTTEEDLNPNLFSKENGRFIEENKLRVVLVSPPHSPVLQPINGALKQEPTPANPVPKETSVLNESIVLKEVSVMKDSPVSKEFSVSEMASPRGPSGIENLCPSHVAKDDDDENLTTKVNHLECKLNEAEKTISRLLDEKTLTIQERDRFQQEVALLRRRCAARVQVGFPLLFVCFIAVVGVAVGYLVHS
uniref:Vesicle-associated protein 1-1 n=1 Tax=Anthurium amnicola TaxID=1678845 RepID=A0A1D1Y4C8_9ARAE